MNQIRMKQIISLVLFLLLSMEAVCFASPGRTSIQLFNKLEGRWVAEQPNGSTVIEAWWFTRAAIHVGVGFTISAEGDTSTFEWLELREIDGVLNYIADVPHNDQPIMFPLSETDGDSVYVFLNNEHDFPKRIQYIFSQTSPRLQLVVDDNGNSDRGFQLNFIRRPNPTGSPY